MGKKIALELWRIMLVLLILAIILGAGYGIIRLGGAAITWISGSVNNKPAATQTATPNNNQPQTQTIVKTVIDNSAVKAAEAEAAAAKKAAEDAQKKANESEAAKKAAEEAQKKAEEAQKKLEAEKKAAEEAAKKAAPSIVSSSIQSVNNSTVIVRARVFAGGTKSNITVKYGTSKSNLTSWGGSSSVAANATETVELGLTGLSANTKYYYVVTADNSTASVESEPLSFTTSGQSDNDPSIISVDEQNLSANGVTIKARVEAGSSQTRVWVEYGTSSGNLAYSTSKSTVSADNTDTVYIGVTGLSANTTYYYRVVADCNNGSDHSGIDSFVTSNSGSSQVAHAASLFDVATWQNTDNNTYIKLTLGSLGTQPSNRRVWIEQAAINGSTSYIYCIGTTSSYDTTPTFPKSNGTLFKLHIEGVAGETGMTDVNRTELSDYTFTIDRWYRAE